MSVSREFTRRLLGSVLAVVALNAFAGGYYGMSGAKGVPADWLAGSPFTSYMVPSLVLFFVVGGSCLFAAIALFARLRVDRIAAFASGAVLLMWIVAQVSVIGYVSWLQPTIFTVGIAVLFLATRLHATRRVD
jgi:hypothetical protein